VIALALSAVFLGEAITPTKAAAAAAALAGVALMMGSVGMDHTGTCKRPRTKGKNDDRP